MATLPYLSTEQEYGSKGKAQPAPANDVKSNGIEVTSPQGQRALEFARKGIRIFPCWECDGNDPNTGKPKKMKDPYTPKGFKDATDNENMIRCWWGLMHPNALIGIPCTLPAVRQPINSAGQRGKR